jgi:hypothetical protein
MWKSLLEFEMPVVIASDVTDYHAASVSWALGKVGVPYIQWEGAGHEIERQVSLEFIPVPRVWIGGYEVTRNDVFWYRRPRRFSCHPDMADLDRKFVFSEAWRFAENMGVALEATGCRCINPSTAAWTINRKGAQLIVALQSGLNVPKTLMGNASKRIGGWLGTLGDRHIYKGFQPHAWENSVTGGAAMSETVEMPEYTEGLDEQLSYVPGIYQDLVVKLYDVRVFVAGERIRGFMVRSPMLDWRMDLVRRQAHTEEVEIPDSVAEGLRNFMLRSGIVCGSFDFAVDKDSWWFLEVNETGQFLWIDQMIPQAGVFQDFLSFLTGMDRALFPPLVEFSYDHDSLPERPVERSSISTIEV